MFGLPATATGIGLTVIATPLISSSNSWPESRIELGLMPVPLRSLKTTSIVPR